MNSVVAASLVSGGLVVLVREGISWLRNRSKDEAEAGLTVDERWKNLADKYEERITDLEARMTKTEADLELEQNRSKGLQAEVDHYKSIARSLLRYMLKLRDAMTEARVDPPAYPPDIEDALTGIDLP